MNDMQGAPRDGTPVLLHTMGELVVARFRRSTQNFLRGSWIIDTTPYKIGATLDDETNEWDDSAEQPVTGWEPLP